MLPDALFAPDTLILLSAIFVLAGLVKGVLGMGMPTVGVYVLLATLERDAFRLDHSLHF